MKKIFLLSLVILCVLLAALPVYAADDRYVKVGLLYGNDSLAAVNFQNLTGGGKGYLFGTFASDLSPIPNLSTDVSTITVLREENYAFKDKAFSVTSGAEVAVGKYHLQITDAFATEALARQTIAAMGLNDGYVHFAFGEYFVRIGQYATLEGARDDLPFMQALLPGVPFVVVGGNASTLSIASFETGAVLAQITLTDGVLAVVPQNADGAPITWFKQVKYLGNFSVNMVGADKLSVINVPTLADYCKGVLPYEISPEWPIEAQKAAALCAKSYILYYHNRHASNGFSVCAGNHCQIYKGPAAATEVSDLAVDEIAGLQVVYDGKPIQGFYHSSNGGSTEDCRNVWGGSVPYLLAVEDHLENIENIPNGLWETTVTFAEITAILKQKGHTKNDIVNVYIEAFTPAGNVSKLTFVDSTGAHISFEREAARTVLSSVTKSLRYTIVVPGSVSESEDQKPVGNSRVYELACEILLSVQELSGIEVVLPAPPVRVPMPPVSPQVSVAEGDSVTFRGRGYGHSVGLSQWGAKYKAELGYSCEQILKFYYTGAEVVAM